MSQHVKKPTVQPARQLPPVERLKAAARNLRVIQAVLQALGVVFVVLIGWWLLENLLANLDRLNISTDFGFLTQPTGFDIPENRGFDPRLPVWRMILIGFQNTILAAFVGIIIATILGVIIGISRLSSNLLVNKLSQLYVETFRNIPALVIIIFFSFAVFVFGPFPTIQSAREFKLPGGSGDNWLIVSNSRIAIPSFISENYVAVFWAVVVVAAIVAVAIWVWRTKVSAETGKEHHRLLWSSGVFVAIAVITFVALGRPYTWSWPIRDETGFGFEGGFTTSAAYLSITLALGLYTASHIAEIVRGSILSVSTGQTEAAESLSLTPFKKYRFVILPQALRVAVPSITNNYLNLTKNTSLGAAIGYAELAQLTRTSYASTSPAPQAILIMMCAYLVLSLTISLIANGFNRTLRLKER